jgi:hypothetical protein
MWASPRNRAFAEGRGEEVLGGRETRDTLE